MAHVRSTTKVQNSAATSVAVTLTAAVPVGNTLLIGCCWESAAGSVPTITSVVDSRGNTYTTSPDASANAGTTLAVGTVRGRVTTALQVGDTITITISVSRSRWAIQVDEFDDLTSTPLDKVISNSPGSASALSTGTTAATTQASELLYAVFGFGSGRTTAIPAGWDGGAKVETSAGSTDRALQVTWKYVVSTGTQEGTLTISSASTYAAAMGTYKATAVAPAVARVSQVALDAPEPGPDKVARVSQVALQAPAAPTGSARVAQVSLTVPAAPGQRPPSGIKVAGGGTLHEVGLSVAVNGEI